MDTFRELLPGEAEFVQEQIEVFRKKEVDGLTLESIKTVEDVEVLMWESSHKKLIYMMNQEKAQVSAAIYNFRKTVGQELEPDISVKYDLLLMLNQLDETLWNNSPTVPNLKKGNIAQSMYFLRKVLKGYVGENNQELKTKALAFLGVIERNGLLFKYKDILEKVLPTFQILGINLFNES